MQKKTILRLPINFHGKAALKNIVPAASHADTCWPGYKFGLIDYNSQVFFVYISELDKNKKVFEKISGKLLAI